MFYVGICVSKQKTANEMRSSDWSSDVCSSDLVGGGLLGAAIAYGAARAGTTVCVLDQGDSAFRASRGNFGLVWLHGKGKTSPDYARWTKEGLRLWQIGRASCRERVCQYR